MSQAMTEAMKSAKTIQQEMVQWENRVEMLKSEIATHTKTRDLLKEEIDKKTAEYSMWMAGKDADIKKSRADLETQSSKLESDKKEFIVMLQDFQKDKSFHEQAKRDYEIEKQKDVSRRAQLDQFVIAVQRAYTLLG